VSNVRIAPAEIDGDYEVRSNFICYRNRLRDEVDLWAGERRDLLRRAPAGADGGRSGARWRIARRLITLDQNVVLSKNLSVFF
jgi:3-phenylpropionate/cinnamic acid dioxygenase small subunit